MRAAFHGVRVMHGCDFHGLLFIACSLPGTFWRLLFYLYYSRITLSILHFIICYIDIDFGSLILDFRVSLVTIISISVRASSLLDVRFVGNLWIINSCVAEAGVGFGWEMDGFWNFWVLCRVDHYQMLRIIETLNYRNWLTNHKKRQSEIWFYITLNFAIFL